MDSAMDLYWRQLMVRERELHVAQAEYAFLSVCGGVRPEDVQRLRAFVTGVVPPPVIVKVEPLEEVTASELVPLKQLVRELWGDAPDGQLNSLCRSVRGACGEALRVFKRHQATFVRLEDRAVVENALKRVGHARMDTFDDM
jgi:hypothetical protein